MVQGPRLQGRDRAEGAATCAGAIVVALISNGLAIGKILKIKAAIKAAGGAKKFATKVIKQFKKYKEKGDSNKEAIKKAIDDAAEGAGSDTVKALLEFFSINAVLSACFGL